MQFNEIWKRMKLFVIDQHDQLIHIWRELKLKNLDVVHVDFHCDMRGLLVDRENQCGWEISEVRKTLDEGNYLRYAIFEGIVKAITWVHGVPGGRLYDVHTVKYTSDLLSRRYRRTVRDNRALPLSYQVFTMEDWTGVDRRVFLDIDWDTFADCSLPIDEIERRVDQFLSKPIAKELDGICICYSPYHSHPSDKLFHDFVAQVAARFGAEIERRKYIPGSNELPWTKRIVPRRIYDALQGVYHRFRLGMKRVGIQ